MRARVVSAFCIVAWAVPGNWLAYDCRASPMGTTRIRNALVFFSTAAVNAGSIAEHVIGVAEDEVFTSAFTVGVSVRLNRLALPAGVSSDGGSTKSGSAAESTAWGGRELPRHKAPRRTRARTGEIVWVATPLLADSDAPVTAIDASGRAARQAQEEPNERDLAACQPGVAAIAEALVDGRIPQLERERTGRRVGDGSAAHHTQARGEYSATSARKTGAGLGQRVGCAPTRPFPMRSPDVRSPCRDSFTIWRGPPPWKLPVEFGRQAAAPPQTGRCLPEVAAAAAAAAGVEAEPSAFGARSNRSPASVLPTKAEDEVTGRDVLEVDEDEIGLVGILRDPVASHAAVGERMACRVVVVPSP